MHDDGTPPLLTVDGGVATITLNRPRHHNRLHDEDLRALIGHVQAVDRDPAVRVLVLAARVRSDAPVFSAGFHVGAFGDDAGAAVRAFAAAADAVAAARPVTMAALNGSVYGGATDLALACDFRLGVEGMELRMPAAALGLHYYPSGLRRAVATIGLRAARRLFLLGLPLDAAALQALGFLDECVSAEDLPAAVRQRCEQVLALAPLALQGMKQTLQEMALGEDQPARWEARAAATYASADFAEGRAAFGQRRAPRFLGR
jgi:enoyl-CoA hydratase/carnithine racemase